ncbi:diphosphomevalonate decarboxylase [Candidatus Gottesmanbacteria bacterium]|nr:diphosphomevalonate decarboxylase [Candidatus Gottesmanbacteria bacterium]
MKATAIAPANIAFIKYWGKADNALRLPLNASISMNLSECTTTTTVEFSQDYTQDYIEFLFHETYKNKLEHDFVGFDKKDFSEKEKQRVVKLLDRMKALVKSNLYAKVVTKNSFPKSAGVASSASGFAALTVASARALDLKLSEKELTALARIGSGSACRSIPDGFVMWMKGNTSRSSYAYSLYPQEHWDLRDILLVTDTSQKKIATTKGMDKIRTSPFWGRRLRDMPDKIKMVKKALAKKDFRMLGEVIEEEAINMHAVMMTQKPPLFYWNGVTMSSIQAVQKWRSEGIAVYFTIDAGPTVHLICEGKDEQMVLKRCTLLQGIKQIIVNKPSKGTQVVDDHLF